MVSLLAVRAFHYLTVQSFQSALKPFEMILERAIHGESYKPQRSALQRENATLLFRGHPVGLPEKVDETKNGKR
jgi:hypothetical protein